MSNNIPKNPGGKNPQSGGAGKPADPKASLQSKPAEAKSGPPSKTPASVTPPAPPAVVPPLYRRIDWISFTVTALLVFIGYIWTLAPDLTLEDCGELSTGSFYAGVPHPPGYPVWTVYTWFFTLLPIANIAYRVAISSAFAGGLSCGLVALMVSRGSSMIIEGMADLKNIDRRWENPLCMISGFVAGMLIGFNGFMWSQAIIVEVYTLSVLSLTGVLACLLRWIYAPHQLRYLFFAFFWYGICFNNHQSLLVIVMGMEIGIIAVSPRLGRNFLFWNSVIYVIGLVLSFLGMIGLLSDNPPVLVIFNLIGIASICGWIVLMIKTKIRGLELARDLAMAATIGYLGILLGSITNFITFFEFRTSVFVLFNMVGLTIVGVFIWLITKTRSLSKDWISALICGGAFVFGAAFYLYMPLASMSNPPLNWGYPRTVQGFYHALSRGQYERIHPTTEFGRYIDQLLGYVGGVLDEFNLVYVVIGLLPLFFLKKMQARERSWLIGLTAIYITLSVLLLELLNPAPDRQSRDLNRPFFIASHVLVVMGIGYGLTIVGAYLAAQFERFRQYCLYAALGAAAVALLMVAVTFEPENGIRIHTLIVDLDPTYSPLVRFTTVFTLIYALAGVALFFFNKKTLPRLPLLVLFCLMPTWSILSHWEENEQRGHLFGYWFGHDMFTPPFNDPKTNKPLYPEMDRDTVLYGGTDPGRFNPTYMIFCESFIPPSKRRDTDRNFDRRDVYLITQNALADGTYLQYIRAHYNRSDQPDPPFFSELVRGSAEVGANEKTNIIACLLRPLDRFFLKLGDDIEKRRRAGTSHFKETDFNDLNGFVARLRPGPQQDAVGKYLYDNLTKDTQQLLTGSGDEKRVRKALVRDLNVILEKEFNNKEAWSKKLDEKAALERTAASVAAAAAAADAANDPDPVKAQKIAAEKQRLAGERQRLAGELQRVQADLAPMMLYDRERFKGVQLSSRTQRFIAQVPRSHTRIRLNRILLEEAYPQLIARTIGGVYPDLEILSATNEDSQKAFQEYLNDAQKRLDHDRRLPNEPRQIKPGEDVKIIENRVQVSGQVAVMAINGLLTKIIFDKNPDHEFYVEESFPLDWMYEHLTPFGIIMKINRDKVPEITQEMVDRDHEFWSQFATTRLIGNVITYDTTVSNVCDFCNQIYVRREKPKSFKGDWKFIRDNDGQKAFSKLRSSIAGVYNWRISNSKSPAEQQRMIKEAEFAFKQAYAFCPYSPEAIFRYINLLVTLQRIDDALLIATTSLKLDPFNAQIDNLISELKRIKGIQNPAPPPAAAAPPSADAITAEIAQLEQQFKTQSDNLPLGFRIASGYLQLQQPDKATALLDQLIAHPKADAGLLFAAAQTYAQLGQIAKVEQSLTQLVKNDPENPEGRFNLAAVQAVQNKGTQALATLSDALKQSAARLQREPTAANLYSNVLTDARFAALRQMPQFQQLLDSYKPK